MEPVLSAVADNGQELTFTLAGVDPSVANALRRVILSEIPALVFRTTPHEANKCQILENTSRLNNEIIKQRLSCIPIHISDLDIPWDKYELELKKTNDQRVPIVVTTQDFRIKDTSTGNYIAETDSKKIFPPNAMTQDYIDFLRLRPRILEGGGGESIHLTCKFDIGTAKDDGCFIQASTCAYGNTPDLERAATAWAEKEAALKQGGMDADKILLEKKDWMLLDGRRIYKDNSFDFRVESVGVYENSDLVKQGCMIMIDKISKFEKALAVDGVKIEPSNTTVEHSFDVTLEDEDYTFGKVIESILYEKFYTTGALTYCGFKKFHPHDPFSIIRLAFPSADPGSNPASQHLVLACQQAKSTYESILGLF